MRQLKYISLALILIAIISISGCISMEVNQKIKSNGDSTIEITYDLSAIPKMTELLGSEVNTSDFVKNYTQICTNFYEKETKLKNAKCRTMDDYKITISGEISLKNSPALKISRSIPYVTYRYDVKNVYAILSDVGESQGQEFSDTQLSQAKSMAGLMGMELKYLLEMPGKITKADAGDIRDNKVEIDIFDLVGKENVYVESKELNLLWDLCILGITAFVVILIFIKRRSKKLEQYPQQQYYQQPA